MKLSTQIILAFSMIILLTIVDSFIHYRLSQKVAANTQFLTRSEDVIRNSNRTHMRILEMQSAFRGYLLTSDSTFLLPFDEGLKSVPNLILELRRLIADSLHQTDLLDSIHALHHQWIGYAKLLVESKMRYENAEDSLAEYNRLFETKLKKQVGKKINDAISAKFSELELHEYHSRNERSQQLQQSIRQNQKASTIFLFCSILIGFISAIFIIRQIVVRIRQMVRQAENISKGEFTTTRISGNDELTSLTRSLNIMSKRLEKNIIDLENRNAELNKFAYVVSHDLKAPVRGIHNVVTWIEEDYGEHLPREVKDYLRIIPERARRMEDLINGLLNYARISHRTAVETVDSAQMIKQLQEILVPRHFKFETNNLPVLYTERIKLEQVFSNLISNAVKYNDHPQPAISINATEQGDHYEFSITDNGIGIDPEYHRKIFEIFQTLRKKNETESTGIGLAIVKKIIDEHHGRLEVTSKEGHGSTFTFTWPKQELKKI